MSTQSSENNSHAAAIEAGYETHDVSIPYIVGFAVICITAIVLGVLMVDSFFVYTKEQLVHNANKVEPKALLELRAQEKEKLSTFALLDGEKGIYRIPISRAMKLLSEESFEENFQ